MLWGKLSGSYLIQGIGNDISRPRIREHGFYFINDRLILSMLVNVSDDSLQ